MDIPRSKFLKSLLTPASLFYGMAAATKLSLYQKGMLASYKAEVPVISVGNITVGGTGKTPITIDLANRLSKEGLKVAILSRGYKRKSDAPHTIVSDGKNILSSCPEAGDEPYLMALSCPGSIVISGADRSGSAKLAQEKYGCDIILLDDGFQHLKLKRDHNIMLVDFTDNIRDELPVPAGRLREPLSGLNRATAFVVTKVPRVDERERLEQIRNFLKKHNPRADFFTVRFEPKELRSQKDNKPLQYLEGKSVVALSAIARPEAFINSLEEFNVRLVSKLIFPDHHWFTHSDMNTIEKTVQSTDADLIITTEKDLVRLNLQENLNQKTFAIVLKTEWLDGAPDFARPPLKTSTGKDSSKNGA